MKHLLVFVLMLVLLTACGESEPSFTDNGNPGDIKAVVFYDDNQNGIMDSGETGAPAYRLALAEIRSDVQPALGSLLLYPPMQTVLLTLTT